MARVGLVMAALFLVAAACSDEGTPNASTSASTSASTTTDATSGATTTVVTVGGVPDVDLTISAVPIEEVYFDTFDGGAVRLSDSDADLRRSLLDVIPPIDDPVYGQVADGDWLLGGDLVLGYVADGQAYAYPHKILNYHELVGDELGGTPVLISYCPLCRSGIVYDRRLGEGTLSFGNSSALYESDLVMVDRETGSYWWQVAGTAIVGALTGAALTPLPSLTTTWDNWTELHPDTLLLTRDTGFARPYESDPFISYGDVVNEGRFAFPVGDASRDDRLNPAATVLGVMLGGEHRVYPLEALGDEAVNDSVAGTPLVVFSREDGPAGAAFERAVDGTPLEFAVVDDGYVDLQTNSRWGLDGLAISGQLAGTQLVPLPNRTTFWFAYVGAFPDAEVYLP